MYLPVSLGATIYFAQPDALKVSNLHMHYMLVKIFTSKSLYKW